MPKLLVKEITDHHLVQVVTDLNNKVKEEFELLQNYLKNNSSCFEKIFYSEKKERIKRQAVIREIEKIINKIKYNQILLDSQAVILEYKRECAEKFGKEW